MINAMEYVYPKMIVTYSGTVYTIGRDDKVYNKSGTWCYTNATGVKMISENFNAVALLDDVGNVYTGNVSSVNVVVSMPSGEDIVWVSAGGKNATFMAVSKSGKLYGWGANTYGQLAIGNTSSVSMPKEIELPAGERAFMAVLGSRQSALLTLSGNVYVAGADFYLTGQTSGSTYTWKKIQIDQVTNIAYVYGEANTVPGLYMVDTNGEVWCLGSDMYKGPIPSKVFGITNAWYVVCSNNTSGSSGIVKHDGVVYVVTGINAINASTTGFDQMALTKTGVSFYGGKMDEVWYGNTGSMTKDATMSNHIRGVTTEVANICIYPIVGKYVNPLGEKFDYTVTFTDTNDPQGLLSYVVKFKGKDGHEFTYVRGDLDVRTSSTPVADQERLANTKIDELKTELNLYIGDVVPPDTVSATHVATNGIQYTVKTMCMKNTSGYIEYDAKIRTEYHRIGYEVYAEEVVTINASNYTEYESILKEKMSAQMAACIQYLDTRIETVKNITPVTRDYLTASGKTFFMKTEFEIGETDDTHSVITYRTVYGPTDQYGKVYREDTYTVRAGNYPDYETDLNEIGLAEIEECKKLFGIWDVVVPGNEEKTFTNTGGLTYTVLVKYAQSTVTDESNSILYTITYSSNETPTTTHCSKTLVINQENVLTASSVLKGLVDRELEILETRLDVPDVTLPETVEETYTIRGFSYKLTVSYRKGDSVNTVITTAYIDGDVFGDSTVSVFTKTEGQALSDLKSLTNGKMNSMKNACSNSPANTDEIYTVGMCKFQISTEYLKTADNKNVVMRLKLDGKKVYGTDVVLSIENLTQNLSQYQLSMYNKTNELKGTLSKMPKDSTELYTVEGMNFALHVAYTKEAGSSVVDYYTECDADKHIVGQCAIDETLLDESISTLRTNITAALSSLKTELLNKCPRTTTEQITVNGFSFFLGLIYSKSANSSKSASGVTIDGELCNTMTRTLSYNTLDTDIVALVANCQSIRQQVLDRLNDSPTDRDREYTVDGISYRIQTLFNKTAGSDLVTITTMLDGAKYETDTLETSAATILDDIDTCHLIAEDTESKLIQILDQSPKNTANEVYTVNEFDYLCGAVYEKESMSTRVNVTLMIDNKAQEFFSCDIEANDPERDIQNLKGETTSRLNVLKSKLYGIRRLVIPWKVKSFEFNIITEYTKSIEDHTVTIRNYIDNQEYMDKEVLGFTLTNREDIVERGEYRARQIQSLLNTAPEDLREGYSIGNMNFILEVVYQKNAGDIIVFMTKKVDGVAVDRAQSIPFDPNNIGSLSDKGVEALISMQNTLSHSPMDYSHEFSIGEMAFQIGSKFSKAAGDSNVDIVTTLDGEPYSDPHTVTFNYIDIPAITSAATTRETLLKSILKGLPNTTSEVYTVRHCLYRISKTYRKAANDKDVYVAVKLDNATYGEVDVVEFNINNMALISDSVNLQVRELKRKLDKATPRDLDVMKTINGFDFLIKAHFLKEPDNDTIFVQYDVDSADI